MSNSNLVSTGLQVPKIIVLLDRKDLILQIIQIRIWVNESSQRVELHSCRLFRITQ